MELFRKETQDANRPRLHGEIVMLSEWIAWALTGGARQLVAYWNQTSSASCIACMVSGGLLFQYKSLSIQN
jgi:hypothetical protein